ncbi:protein NRT1/ PTR FAMILY 5.3-like isoform X1 [Diospyros lotus]|uniref:protein NRT1/ PTR FAMILY 5.3-like isoform X1 n=1 Tax=Diospyros lotus TaxID=55363 RepID=UPI00225BF16F|nr:protein NRT1/ PTR FAMILY 5.3-like isoform X1 [Diospyros lotus]
MTKEEEEKGGVDGKEDYTQDGTVDLKGRPVQRSETGRWKACSFIVAHECFKRMAYYGLASNLVLYLTNKLHEGTVKSSNNVTNWVGTVWLMSLLGAHIADAHLGRYWTFIISSFIYLVGMCLLTLAVSMPSLQPPSCGNRHRTVANVPSSCNWVLLCLAITLGTGGTKPKSPPWGLTSSMTLCPRAGPRSSPSSIGGCSVFSLEPLCQTPFWCTYRTM